MRILNVGCGQQQYGTHFVDLYPQRPEVVRCDVEKEPLPFPDNYFDEVFCENIFEHLKNPNQALAEMRRVLKMNGVLTVITDNASFWAYHLGTTHYGGYEARSGAADDRHYALYTSWHLENHFRAVDLKDIRVEYLFTASKHSAKLPVRLISKILRLILPNIGFPQIKATGVKQ